MKYAHIIGWGRFLPETVLTNDDIAELVDTSNEWIYARTGIRSRRIADNKETTATIAFEAAARAVARANIHPSELDLIIVATSTPQYSFPSTACQVQTYLGAGDAGAFDLSAACSGFVYGLDMATQAIATGSVKYALVIGAELMSRVLDWEDRGTCILFGDGAGAVVLKGSDIRGGVLATACHADGSGGEALNLPAVYNNPMPMLSKDEKMEQNVATHGAIRMNGRQVFRFATKVVPAAVQEVLDKAGMTTDEVDLIVPHQANVRIIDSAAKKLGVDSSKFFVNVKDVGNTSAASIPIALCDAVESGRLKPNDTLVFVGFGGGLTWASALVKWEVTPPKDGQPFTGSQWRRTRYIYARTRARVRQWRRSTEAWLRGSPTPDARLKDADKK